MTMQQLLSSHAVKDYLAIANDASKILAETAAPRDAIGGLPDQEVEVMKESGILLFPVPRQYGGAGATWHEMFHTTKALAKADGSSGQLYANHITLVVCGKVLGRPEQEEYYFRLTADNNLFWANALNARDTRLTLQLDGIHYRANGVKSFGTGVAVGDINVFGAAMDGVDHPMVFILPGNREGITYNNDWDNMGQRCTASGSYTFDNVMVYANELLGPPPDPTAASTTLVFLLAQLAKTYVYLGIAEGALEAAKAYTLSSTRPWISSGVESADQDPYILQNYGEFWAQHQAAIALADQAASKIQYGYDLGTDLTWEQRGEIAIAVSSAKAVATKVGLDITSGMFGVMGARATSARYRFDRYWRDLRTFTVHDPVDYKLKAVGDWFLNGAYPMPSQYS
jgi:alkylation response protein AidB-like acyl-CoA dehydrogenase